MKQKYKIGDKVEGHLYSTSMKKVKIRGTVKEIPRHDTIILTEGIAQDFVTRSFKKIK